MLLMVWQAFVFSLGIMLPNMLMLGLGFYLRKRGSITDEFSQQGSQLVFNISLPVLLFLSIFNSQIDVSAQITVISVGVIVTIILFIFAEVYAKKRIIERKERGIFVQGVFRANLGIVGLALCASAYGAEGLAIASVYVAVLTILFNVLAIITLTRSLTDRQSTNLSLIFINLIKNPLILAIFFGFLTKWIGLSIPETFKKTGDYLAQVSLPLALICAGSSLDFRRVDSPSSITLIATIGRVVVGPALTLITASFFSLTGISLGIVFLMSIAPTAVASYPMVRAMGGNAKIAANIIGMTAIGSIFSGVLGLSLLRQLGWL